MPGARVFTERVDDPANAGWSSGDGRVRCVPGTRPRAPHTVPWRPHQATTPSPRQRVTQEPGRAGRLTGGGAGLSARPQPHAGSAEPRPTRDSPRGLSMDDDRTRRHRGDLSLTPASLALWLGAGQVTWFPRKRGF